MSNVFPNAKNDDQGNYRESVQSVQDAQISPIVVGSHSFIQSPQYEYFRRKIDTKRRVTDPCGDGTLGEINVFLQKVFIALRGVQKYKSVYVDGAINKIAGLQSTISKLTSSIASVLKGLVQRIRNWTLNKIKELVLQALSYIMTNFLKQIKDSIVAGVIDQIFCAFEKIIAGLFAMVADFLYSLIGQVINMPICAVEQWTNALINKLVNDIDKALEPIFEQINDILGGVAKITGSVSGAIDTILGFQGFLCNTPKCPELKEFAASPWGGPSKEASASFAKFNFGSSFIDEGTKTANQWMEDFFGSSSNTSQSPGTCYTGLFECGLPQVKIFGGQGSGAVAQAVVNDIGQVIGTNILSGGKNYTSAPFVSFVDPAGCGSNASGYAEIKDGELDDIVIINPGGDYEKTGNGGAPVFKKFVGTPNPINLNKTVTLEWDIENADKVSLLGFANYKDLPSSGNIKIPITEEFAKFDPESDETSYKFTLEAKKINKQSEDQVNSDDFILTIKKDGSVVVDDGVNTKSPVIDKLQAKPKKAKVGDVVDISWKTSNAQYVTIYKKLEDSTTGKLPAKNSTLSVVIPEVDISTGGTVTQEYTLTATNEDAAGPPTSVTQTVKVTVSEADAEDEDIFDDDGDDDSTDPIVPDDDEEDDGDGEDDADEDADEDGDDDGDDDEEDDDGDDDEEDDGEDDDEEDDGEGDDEEDDDEDDENEAGAGVTVITTIDVINTGIGYTTGDTVLIDNNGGGGQGTDVEIETNSLGQVVSVTVNDPGFGYTRIPTLSINSETGIGALFRARLKFIPLNEFLSDQDLKSKDIDPKNLVRVIDCIT